ncbi:MAG: hypothetical protein ACFFE4_05780 [Candidatus Thorarchaeota archaeon]
MSDSTHITGTLVAKTKKAVLIKFTSGQEVWIPKSTLKDEFRSNTNFWIVNTLALKKRRKYKERNAKKKKLKNAVAIHRINRRRKFF